MSASSSSPAVGGGPPSKKQKLDWSYAFHHVAAYADMKLTSLEWAERCSRDEPWTSKKNLMWLLGSEGEPLWTDSDWVGATSAADFSRSPWPLLSVRRRRRRCSHSFALPLIAAASKVGSEANSQSPSPRSRQIVVLSLDLGRVTIAIILQLSPSPTLPSPCGSRRAVVRATRRRLPHIGSDLLPPRSCAVLCGRA